MSIIYGFLRFSSKSSPTLKLNTIVERDKDKLMFELESRAYNWIDFLKHVDVEKFGHDLQYKTSAGQEMSTMPLHYCMCLTMERITEDK